MKPAIFNTEMVRAILDGRKTQTRRVVNNIPKSFNFQRCGIDRTHGSKTFGKFVAIFDDGNFYEFVSSPYQVGDIIYVRETWQEVFEIEYMRFGIGDLEAKNIKDCIANFETIYKIKIGMSDRYSTPNSEPRMRYIVYKAEELQYTDKKYALHWNPSIHMPKEYARLFLRVKDVRIERLNEISEEDAIKEGVDGPPHVDECEFDDECNVCNDPKDGSYAVGLFHGECDSYICGKCLSELSAINEFKKLWESIYGNGSFDNRYVWVIEFEKISKEEELS